MLVRRYFFRYISWLHGIEKQTDQLTYQSTDRPNNISTLQRTSRRTAQQTVACMYRRKDVAANITTDIHTCSGMARR